MRDLETLGGRWSNGGGINRQSSHTESTHSRVDRLSPERSTPIMVTLPDELVEAAMEELEHTPAFKTLWQSEAIYLEGIRHALGDEYLSSLVKLTEIYDTRTRAVAQAAFRLGTQLTPRLA